MKDNRTLLFYSKFALVITGLLFNALPANSAVKGVRAGCATNRTSFSSWARGYCKDREHFQFSNQPSTLTEKFPTQIDKFSPFIQQEGEIEAYCNRLVTQDPSLEVFEVPEALKPKICSPKLLEFLKTHLENSTSPIKTETTPKEEKPCDLASAAIEGTAAQLGELAKGPQELLKSPESKKKTSLQSFEAAKKYYLEKMEEEGARLEFRPYSDHFNVHDFMAIHRLLPGYKIHEPRPEGDLTLYHQDFVRTIENLFPKSDSKNLVLIPPKTPPGSGAMVYLIQDSSKNRVIGALKVQMAESGLNEVISVAAAESIIAEKSPHTKLVQTLAAGKLVEQGSPDDPRVTPYFLVQTAADGADLGSYMKALSQTSKNKRKETLLNLKRAVLVSAATLAGFHKDMSQGERTQKNHFQFLNGVIFESGRVQGGLLAGPEVKGSLKYWEQEGVLAPETRKKIAIKIKDLQRSYGLLATQRPDLFRVTTTHGDWHAGNIFIAPKKANGEMIDYATALWTIGKKNEAGTGDAAADVGRMVASLLIGVLKNGGSMLEAMHAANDFRLHYKFLAGIKYKTPEDKAFDIATDFHTTRIFYLESSSPSFASHAKPSKDLRPVLFKLLNEYFDPNYFKNVEALAQEKVNPLNSTKQKD